MREDRIAERVPSKQQGTVHFTGRPDLSCTLRNLSNTGALLSFPNPVILPRVFDLTFDGQTMRSSVAWQSGRLAGVKFQTPLRGIGTAKKRWPWSRKGK
jgi:hypothetical protein